MYYGLCMNFTFLFLLGTLISTIEDFIFTYNEKISIFRQKKFELKESLKKNRIKKSLMKTSIEYYNYTFHQKNVFKNIKDFEYLSYPLKKQLIFEMYKDFIISSPLFWGLEENQIVDILCEFK